ncbi:DUF1294 domain-containing protein [Streptococcus oricebi]|uniref:DUF1294 domain-containing protein n=1 Tax=Streptococcus oricebi TaxID=1547447 RepID=A0ABS5B0V4_9STRE|nr:DUF1294 domain-containing protein [Streptococcus oricebi]MBP2622467.1 DUF1294 domain-containing protein [Streptococcus oricebi]
MKWLIAIILLIWNGWVFILYGLDKRRARKHLYRISEQTLLTFSLLFAGFGALLAGNYFHHKTRKWYFWLAWLLGSFLQGLLVYFIWRI